MEIFTQHWLFQVLKGAPGPQKDGAQAQMDIKTCFANIPMFIRQLQRFKEQKKIFTVDVQYMNSLKALSQDADFRKQWFAYFLISTTMDQKVCVIGDVQAFHKNINSFLSALSITLNKHEVLTDMFAIALKAWITLTELMHTHYDSKAHASAIQVQKQIMQNVFKKLEKALKFQESKPHSDPDEVLQLRLALKALHTSAVLFPSSMKNLISKSATKKDHVTTVLENLIRVNFNRDPLLIEHGLQLLCILFKSKEKSKLQYREWLSRILQNIVLLVNCIQPRTFDDTQLNQELNMNITFDFIFERGETSQLNKLTIKDVKDTNVGRVLQKFELLFTLLKYSVGDQHRSQLFSGDGVNYMPVEINFQEFIMTIESLIGMQVQRQKAKSSQLSGLQPSQYEQVLEVVKLKSLNLVKCLTTQFKNEMLPYVPKILQLATNVHQLFIKKSTTNFDQYLEIIDLLKHLLKNYGVNTLKFIQEIAFADNDLNVNELVCELMKLVIEKTDTTVIDLSDKGMMKANKAFKADTSNVTKQRQQFPFQELDSSTLEHYLHQLLTFLITFTANSIASLMITSQERCKLETTILHLLTVSELKYHNISTQTKLLILDLAKNLIINKSQKLMVTNDVLACLVSFRSKSQHFLGESNELISKLNEIMIICDPVFAPRREKYQIQTNTLIHFQNEHRSMFIEYNRELLQRYLNPRNDDVEMEPQVKEKIPEKVNNKKEVMNKESPSGVPEIGYTLSMGDILHESKYQELFKSGATKVDDQKNVELNEEDDDDDQLLDMPLIEGDSE